MKSQSKVLSVGISMVALAACNQRPDLGAGPGAMSAPGSSLVQAGDRGRGGPRALEFVSELFVHYAAPTHAGPGPHPDTESDDYHLLPGGPRWPDNSTVKYSLSTSGCADDCANAVNQVNASFDAWEFDAATSLTFTQDNASPDTSPCTGQANSVRWEPIDGTGGTLAFTSVCRNVATKAIVGFETVFDSLDTWSDSGDVGKFDIRNVGTHEEGHAVGLGHDNAPRTGCLTMYAYTAMGETQKRTTGLGDNLGMDALYNWGITGSGPGCGG